MRDRALDLMHDVGSEAAPATHPAADFCVIVPALDEAENVPDLVSELRATFDRHGLRGEVVVVDDGSTDHTAALVTEEASRWPALRLLRHRRNLGKTEALLTAAAATNARWLVLFDADLQHGTDEIPRFLDKLAEGWDIVTGRKVGRYEKGLVSRIYNGLGRALFDVPVSDMNSMKAFRRDILDELSLRHDWHRFFVVLAHARGYRATEIDIDLLPRRHGVSKYGGKGRILVGLLDLMSVAVFLFFARKPMTFFGLGGLALASLGVVVGVVTFALRLLEIATPFGYRPFLYLVVLLETVGFLMFGFGILGELIAQQNAEIERAKRAR
ncbi:MAG TPA: glycosyltransferase [Longimicrobiales bacterium]|nr:glycosyltransferase [Longimicrobiales bacterium]